MMLSTAFLSGNLALSSGATIGPAGSAIRSYFARDCASGCGELQSCTLLL